MISSSPANFVTNLKNEYIGDTIYVDQNFAWHKERSIENNMFIGSGETIFLTSSDSIFHEAPACLAAPRVTMVAKKIISLGITGQRSEPIPVRLYAPEHLVIAAKHLLLGDVIFLEEPKYAVASCEKLTFLKFTEENPDYFENVISWTINDNIEVEIISVTS